MSCNNIDTQFGHMNSPDDVNTKDAKEMKEANEHIKKNIISIIIKKFIKENKMVIFIFFLYLGILCLQEIVLPHFTGQLVNNIKNKNKLIRTFIIIVCIMVFIELIYTYMEYEDALLWPQLHTYVRNTIIGFLLTKLSSNYAEVDIAGVIMRTAKLPNFIFNYIDSMRYTYIPYTLVYILTVAYIGYHDIMLGLLVLILIGLLFSIIIFSPKFCESISYSAERKVNDLVDEMDDIFNNLVSVYSQNQQKEEEKIMEKLHEKYVKDYEKMIMCVYKIKLISFPIMTIFISLFMYRCYVNLQNKKFNAGQFISLFMILMYISNSLWRIVNTLRDVVPRWGKMQESLSMFDVDETTQIQKFSITENIPLKSNDGIVMENVYFKYKDGAKFILNNLSLHIPSNQKIAIIGRIGCGKSTLLKIIMKYYTISSGRIAWNGTSYDNLTPEYMRMHIGYVHQNPSLFKRSIYDNITYGLDQNVVTKEKIRDILKGINMENIFENIPLGLDGNAGRKGSKLSGGQKQMVWLLRIFFKKPEILILDEPTASVDIETKEAIQKMLNLVMENKTVIIVTHDEFLYRLVDRVIEIDSGVVVNDSMSGSKSKSQRPGGPGASYTPPRPGGPGVGLFHPKFL